MNLRTIVNNSRAPLGYLAAEASYRAHRFIHYRPMTAAAVLLVAGLAGGIGLSSAFGMGRTAWLQARADRQQAELKQVREGAQQEINALAARLGELQAQANRLNALGERLTRMGQLQDGEFDFDEPVGVGGGDDDDVHDISPTELNRQLDRTEKTYAATDKQLSVLEALLFDRQLDKNAMPSGAPVDSYITSGFGVRVDPFGHGGENHKGVDFKASVGDPVRVVADGVVSWAGPRGGYGNLVEVDHGNGYVTRYAHNSRVEVKVGDLVRVGDEVAKAGSTGHSTGAHVHFEVWQNGRVVNPLKFLGNGPTPVGAVKRG